MDRGNQNLMNTKNDAHNLCVRPLSGSGGDIAISNEAAAKKPTSSASDTFEMDEQNAQMNNEEKLTQKIKHNVDNYMEGKQHFNCNSKSRSKYSEVGSKLKAELSKYKKELKEYNNTTRDLEEKYVKINFELNEMQMNHDRFVNHHKNVDDAGEYSDSSSSTTGSEYSLKRKYTQVFHRGNSFMTMLPPAESSTEPITTLKLPAADDDDEELMAKIRKPLGVGDCVVPSYTALEKRHVKRRADNKENEPPYDDTPDNRVRTHPAALKDIYKVLKNVFDANSKPQPGQGPARGLDFDDLQTTVSNLQKEQAHFRNIIQQQQSCLHDYHSRCLKAQHIMHTQQIEIEKLNNNNQQLETEITSGIDELRVKIDSKLRDVSHLPQKVRDEHFRYEKVSKENSILQERLRLLQCEADQIKLKMEEMIRRKSLTINRLKAADRDLKIFKNYNTALKHEKRRLTEELQKVKEQLQSMQNTNKRCLMRQREQNEKQRRDLQKRVFELELKLSRSQNSTSGLIQERDSLIAELQTQLNTLVHNFEISQKHIRVLRRHIYTMSGNAVRGNNRIINESI